jgi:two-component system, NtrC family, response regulator AtoC
MASKARATVLIVDDEKNTREGMELALTTSGYKILLAGSGEEALALLKKETVDLLLTDLIMGSMDGMALMRQARELDPEILVIMLTAYGTVETAVQAMRAGAFDYLTKPVNLDKLELLVKRALNSRRIEKENVALRKQLDSKFGFESIIGHSKKIKEVFSLINQVNTSKATVLIQGESGTGKELIARAIHFSGPRKDQPFVAVHCAALAEGLLESELFGHEKGAFTGAVERKIGRFEAANGGTLFLDEVSEMSPATQVKLLRVLQEMEFERVGGNKTIKVDVRIIAATNKDLRQAIAEGQFREDLFYRLNVVTIPVPPLRDRMEDTPLLIAAFVKEFAHENEKIVEGVSPALVKALDSYTWPGNVRELQNTIETMVVLTRNRTLQLEDVPANLLSGPNPVIKAQGALPLNVHEAEKNLIEKALQTSKNNKSKAAVILGMSRRTLHRKLKSYNLSQEMGD